jgi:hypothetical protein
MSKVVSSSRIRSSFNWYRFSNFSTVLSCCEQRSRQNGRPHDLTCKPTVGTISHRTFNPNAVSFSFLFGLRKKTTSLRAELTAKRPAAQLNVLADRKALSNNNHRWITPAVLMTNIRSTA